MPEDQRQPGYETAMDMPSFMDLMEKLQAAKLLTLFIAQDKRPTLLDLEQQLKSYVATVDSFYDRLGDRHWILHNLNLESVADLLAADISTDELERRFIEET